MIGGQVRRLLHNVLTGEFITALLGHLNHGLCLQISVDTETAGLVFRENTCRAGDLRGDRDAIAARPGLDRGARRYLPVTSPWRAERRLL